MSVNVAAGNSVQRAENNSFVQDGMVWRYQDVKKSDQVLWVVI